MLIKKFHGYGSYAWLAFLIMFLLYAGAIAFYIGTCPNAYCGYGLIWVFAIPFAAYLLGLLIIYLFSGSQLYAGDGNLFIVHDRDNLSYLRTRRLLKSRDIKDPKLGILLVYEFEALRGQKKFHLSLVKQIETGHGAKEFHITATVTLAKEVQAENYLKFLDSSRFRNLITLGKTDTTGLFSLRAIEPYQWLLMQDPVLGKLLLAENIDLRMIGERIKKTIERYDSSSIISLSDINVTSPNDVIFYDDIRS